MKVRSEFNMAGFTRLCRELEAGAQEAAHEAALDYGRIFTKAAIDWTPPSGGEETAPASRERKRKTARKRGSAGILWALNLPSPAITVPAAN